MANLLKLSIVISIIGLSVIFTFNPLVSISHSKEDVITYNSYLKWKKESPIEYKMVMSERVSVKKIEKKEKVSSNMDFMNKKKTTNKKIKIKQYKFDKSEVLTIQENIDDYLEKKALTNKMMKILAFLLIIPLIVSSMRKG